MSEKGVLARYRRGGGRPPADDESLTVLRDGAFEARRTVAGTRVGRFAGSLPASTLKALVRDVERAADAEGVRMRTPLDGATEVVEVGRRSVRLGAGEPPPKPWAPLVRRLRTLINQPVLDNPVAAIELRLGQAGLQLVHVGAEPIELDPGTVTFRMTRLRADGMPLGSASGSLSPQRSGAGASAATWTTAGPGWTLDLPPGTDAPDPADGATVTQIVVRLRIREGGIAREARLIAMPEVTAGDAASGDSTG